jgi:hypothetical protein
MSMLSHKCTELTCEVGYPLPLLNPQNIPFAMIHGSRLISCLGSLSRACREFLIFAWARAYSKLQVICANTSCRKLLCISTVSNVTVLHFQPVQKPWSYLTTLSLIEQMSYLSNLAV